MRLCEIIFVKSDHGWKWRALDEDSERERAISEETFDLFYDCVSAARARGYTPNIKCP